MDLEIWRSDFSAVGFPLHVSTGSLSQRVKGLALLPFCVATGLFALLMFLFSLQEMDPVLLCVAVGIGFPSFMLLRFCTHLIFSSENLRIDESGVYQEKRFPWKTAAWHEPVNNYHGVATHSFAGSKYGPPVYLVYLAHDLRAKRVPLKSYAATFGSHGMVWDQACVDADSFARLFNVQRIQKTTENCGV